MHVNATDLTGDQRSILHTDRGYLRSLSTMWGSSPLRVFVLLCITQIGYDRIFVDVCRIIDATLFLFLHWPLLYELVHFLQNTKEPQRMQNSCL